MYSNEQEFLLQVWRNVERVELALMIGVTEYEIQI